MIHIVFIVIKPFSDPLALNGYMAHCVSERDHYYIKEMCLHRARVITQSIFALICFDSL